jgi:hypothetical protein
MPSDAAPTAFVPGGLGGGGPVTAAALQRQPAPTQPYKLDAHGSLVRPAAVVAQLRMGSTREQDMSAAAGWSPGV